MKQWYHSKTMWLNLATGVIGVVITTISESPIDPKVAGMVVSGLSAVNMFLRSITSQGIGKIA